LRRRAGWDSTVPETRPQKAQFQFPIFQKDMDNDKAIVINEIWFRTLDCVTMSNSIIRVYDASKRALQLSKHIWMYSEDMYSIW
jgi:hypothetical protein